MSDIEYLYGNYAPKKKTGLSRDIEIAEKMLNNQKQARQEDLEDKFDADRLQHLKTVPIASMTWDELTEYDRLIKKHHNVGKDFSGNDLNDFPQSAGSVPDTTAIRSKIVATCNGLIPKLPAGYSVQPLQEGATLQEILGFVTSYRDALKNGQHPESLQGATEIEEEPDPNQVHKSSGYTRRELIATRKEISKMLKELDEVV